jgi:hypothetical protein
MRWLTATPEPVAGRSCGSSLCDAVAGTGLRQEQIRELQALELVARDAGWARGKSRCDCRTSAWTAATSQERSKRFQAHQDARDSQKNYLRVGLPLSRLATKGCADRLSVRV